MDTVSELQHHTLLQIQQAKDLKTLEGLRISVLGKKGSLTERLKQLKTLPPEEKRSFGAKVNEAKQAITTALQAKQEFLKAQAQAPKNGGLDVSLPGRKREAGSIHPVTKALLEMQSIFMQMGYQVASGNEIETDYYNFEALNIPKHHPARAMQDTFYFPDGRLLRTHTSPVQIHVLESQNLPVKIITPGRVYRRDFDITHTPMFHQIEGLYVDKQVSFADLKGVLTAFLQAFFEKTVPVRFRPSYFPFTEPSAEVDIECVRCQGKGCRICSNTGWLEVLGAGLVHPKVLENCGIDSQVYSGFAFGIGVDRFAMLKYQIPDLRMMFENDVRFLRQF